MDKFYELKDELMDTFDELYKTNSKFDKLDKLNNNFVELSELKIKVDKLKN